MKRVMIAAPGSGSGKTLITCGLLRLMKRGGYDVTSFKCGPDYIDPMFHRRVLSVPGGNLDSFFSDDTELRAMVSGSSHGYAVIEGVMGIYDGIIRRSGADTSSEKRSGSCYEIARITDTPVILVMDAKGMGQTLISLIKGILSDDDHRLIRGIILNRISEHYYEQLSPLIRSVLPDHVTLLGGIPSSKKIHLESRHLGLVMPHETEDILHQLDAAADLMQKHLDMTSLYSLFSDPYSDTCSGDGSNVLTERGDVAESRYADDPAPVLAVARDEAFCFYYEENLRMIERAGIRIREFSPLHDKSLPEDSDGILLGGGYPELYAGQLSSNTSMIESIRSAVSNGMPSLAECGGFMYLMETLTDQDGRTWPMCGIIRGGSHYTGRLSRFGYIDITLPGGIQAKGHEFHYFDSSNNGTDAHAVKPGSTSEWDCMHAGPDHLWGYPHLWYPSCPELIARLRARMTQR